MVIGTGTGGSGGTVTNPVQSFGFVMRRDGTAEITFTLSRTAKLRVTISDIAGPQIRLLVPPGQTLPAGADVNDVAVGFQMPIGRTVFTWVGDNDAGEAVSSGFIF